MLHSVQSEVGRLRSVLVHRPGTELARLRPPAGPDLGCGDGALFDGPPWVARAQQEHDSFTDILRAHEVEVLFLADLLAEVGSFEEARNALVGSLLDDPGLGEPLRRRLAGYLSYLDEEGLRGVLLHGLTQQELRSGSGLVYALLGPDDFVVTALPHAVFTRDTGAFSATRSPSPASPVPAGANRRSPRRCTAGIPGSSAPRCCTSAAGSHSPAATCSRSGREWWPSERGGTPRRPPPRR